MAITAAGSGTQTAVIGTEHTLLDVAVAGGFALILDKTNMASGDRIEIRIYQIVLTGGTRRVAYFTAYIDGQPADDALALSPPISNELTDAGSVRFTVKQTAGTGRAFDWKVLKFA